MKYYDPKNFRSRDSLGYLSKMAHTLMHDCADQILSAHDVSFLQWIAMRKLREGTALTASDLCREMRHDNGALTRMLDQLEERGYLARERSEQDRRVVELQLTRSGDRKLDELTPLIVEKLNAALDGFSRVEFDELTRLMKKLIDNLQSVQAGGSGAS